LGCWGLVVGRWPLAVGFDLPGGDFAKTEAFLFAGAQFGCASSGRAGATAIILFWKVRSTPSGCPLYLLFDLKSLLKQNTSRPLAISI